jgi:hypothetical protein
MMELILANQTLNAGCPDFGVKVGGDSEDQIRELLNDVSFQRFIIIHLLNEIPDDCKCPGYQIFVC